MFGTEENKNILSFSSIWMADGTFKVVPLLLVNSIQSTHWLEEFIRFVMGICFHAFMSYFLARVLFFTEGCGIVSNTCVQTPTQITFWLISSRVQLTLSERCGL